MATATSKLARELTEVTRDGAPLDGPRPRDVLARALRSRSAALVAQAARALARGPTPGLGDALRAAYHDLAAARAATLDAGSVAKDAVLEALDRLDDDDAALFAHAAGYVQAERARGRTVDGGARVRARGLLGQARLGHPDFLLLAGAGLGDGDPAVRLAAARALAHRGERDGAALLLLRVAAGDEVADVWTECLHGLFVLAPAFAVRAAEAARHGDDAAARERGGGWRSAPRRTTTPSRSWPRSWQRRRAATSARR
ncbi:MAG: hypothetical protein H6708_28000 [Kofleriaceae bacterium]|nr:hypothetical protein [Kofleriaceae bacterium]